MKIYFETSAVIDYVLATGREYETAPTATSPYVPAGPLNYLKNILREDKRYRLATAVRQALDAGTTRCRCIISPLVRYECYEWLVEERFRNDASEVLLARFVRSFSRKQVGEYLSVIRESATTDKEAARLYEGIVRDFSGENLLGLITEPFSARIDRKNYSVISKYAYLQIGIADVIHLLAARKSKCHFIFTTDDDFNRTRDHIKKDFGIEVLFKDAIFEKIRT